MAKGGPSGKGTYEQQGESLAAHTVSSQQCSAKTELSDVSPLKWQITCDLPDILRVLEEEAELVLFHLQEELAALLADCESRVNTRTGEV